MKSIEQIKLLKGNHEDTGKTGVGCFMNVIAYLNNEPVITDSSECVCYVVRPIAIWVNDFMTDEERSQLLPYILRAMGSRTDDVNEITRRVKLVVEFASKQKVIAAHSAANATAIATAAAAYAAARAAATAADAAAYATYAAHSAAAAYAAARAAATAADAAAYATYAAHSAANAATAIATAAAAYAAARAVAGATPYATTTDAAAVYAGFREKIISATIEFLDEALPPLDCVGEYTQSRLQQLLQLTERAAL